MIDNFSASRVAAQVRDLPIALAHCFSGPMLYAGARGQQRMDLLNRIFVQLDPVDQLRCRAELLECRAAKRGERFAIVDFGSVRV